MNINYILKLNVNIVYLLNNYYNNIILNIKKLIQIINNNVKYSLIN